jgi:hypothetical protein
VFPDNTKTSLASWSLKRVTQRFENATDITENSSLVNDLQSDHENLWRPLCILRSSFSHWTVNVNQLFPLFHWYEYCLRSDHWYSPIPGSILLPAMLFNSFMIVHLCDIDVFSLSGSRVPYLSCRWANPALDYAPLPTHSKNPRDTFLVTRLHDDGWCNYLIPPGDARRFP